MAQKKKAEEVAQVDQVQDVDTAPVEYSPITPESLKDLGAFVPSRARRLFFSWDNPVSGEKHNLSFFYKELTFGSIERLAAAKKLGDQRVMTDILAECLFADVNGKRKLFTAKQLQDELSPSFVSAIVVAVEGAQKKTS